MRSGDIPFLFPGRALGPGWQFGELEPYSFNLIKADPTWRWSAWSKAGEKKSPQAQYETMSTEEICALRVDMLAAHDCLLWLWATWPMLEHAQRVINAWGFAYVTGGAWHKRTVHDKSHFGTGYVLRSSCEPFLIGKRGEPRTTKSVRNIVVGRAREHSRKPEEAYAAAERLMPGARRVELFSRQSRPGWKTWGKEATKFDQGTRHEPHSNIDHAGSGAGAASASAHVGAA